MAAGAEILRGIVSFKCPSATETRTPLTPKSDPLIQAANFIQGRGGPKITGVSVDGDSLKPFNHIARTPPQPNIAPLETVFERTMREKQTR